MLVKMRMRQEAEKTYLGDLLYMAAKGFYKDFSAPFYSKYQKELRQRQPTREEVGNTIEKMVATFARKVKT